MRASNSTRPSTSAAAAGRAVTGTSGGTGLYDLATFGETMIRLSTPLGHRLETTLTLDVGIGGAESNVAVALARLGRRVAWSSVLPRNSWGERIASELRRHGVDDREIHWADGGRVGVYYLDTGSAPRPTHVIYDRAGSAVASCDPDAVDTTLPARARLCHLTGITPALGPATREVARRLVASACDAGVPLSFDVNYRGLLWTPDEAEAGLAPFCSAATILFCGRGDARLLFGLTGDDATILSGLVERFGAPITVLTLGEEGAMVSTREGDVQHQGAVPVRVVDRVGAGDAFAAGFLHGYLGGADDLAGALRIGVNLAALKMTVHGDLSLVNARELAAWSSPAGAPRSIVR